MGMIEYWAVPVIVSILLGVSLITVFSFYDQEGIQGKDFQLDEFKVESSVTLLTPVTKQIEYTTTEISSQEFTAEVTVESISPLFFTQDYDLLQKAYAIPPAQSSFTVTTWTGALGPTATFDSSFNLFSTQQSPPATKIKFINVNDDTTKTWTIPNDDLAVNGFLRMGADSIGNLFFAISSSNGELARLNPTTNVFTIWNTPSSVRNIFTNSNNEIIFSSTGIHKLDPDTATLTTWSNPIGSIAKGGFDLDSSENLYLANQFNKIGRLNLITNVYTEWTVQDEIGAVTSDSSGNIFFVKHDGIRSKLGRINISDNTLTEWIIPISSSGPASDIGVDSDGTVYFNRGPFTRFVPSTEVFTVFGSTCGLLEIDSFDNVYCTLDNSFTKFS